MSPAKTRPRNKKGVAKKKEGVATKSTSPKKSQSSKPAKAPKGPSIWTEPPQNKLDRLIPNDFHHKGRAFNSFLPYLGIGFSFIEPPPKVRERLSSVWSLWRAYRDGVNTLIKGGKKEIKFADFLREYKSPNFVQKSAKLSGPNLEIQKLRILLASANKRWKTDFGLGYVTEGYRCRWIKKTEDYDTDYVRRRTISLATDDNTRGPIVWIYNNNVENKYKAWGYDAAKEGQPEKHDQWEALGIPENANEEDGRKRVLELGLGTLLSDLFKQGIHTASGDFRSPQGGNVNYKEGSFITTSGKQAMENRKGKNPPKLHIGETLKLHEKAPAPQTYDGFMNGEEGAEEEILNKNVKGWKETAQGLAAHQRFEIEHDLGELLQENIVGEEQTIKFIIYRVTPVTNKVGGKCKEESEPSRQFKISTGDFLLDTKGNARCIDYQQSEVKDIDGNDSTIKRRALQKIDDPWGFSKEVIVTGVEPDFTTANKDRLKAAAKRRSVRSKGDEKALLSRIQEWESQKYLKIPLLRLKKEYTANQAKGDVPFKKREIVRLLAETKTHSDILDFEHQPGRVNNNDLEIPYLRTSNQEKHVPFGYRLVKKQLPKSLDYSKITPGSTPQDTWKAVKSLQTDEEAKKNSGGIIVNGKGKGKKGTTEAVETGKGTTQEPSTETSTGTATESVPEKVKTGSQSQEKAKKKRSASDPGPNRPSKKSKSPKKRAAQEPEGATPTKTVRINPPAKESSQKKNAEGESSSDESSSTTKIITEHKATEPTPSASHIRQTRSLTRSQTRGRTRTPVEQTTRGTRSRTV